MLKITGLTVSALKILSLIKKSLKLYDFICLISADEKPPSGPIKILKNYSLKNS